MSRGGIGSGSRSGIGAGAGGGSSSSSSSGPSHSAAELSALFDADEDPVSLSLDAEFEGGQWINGEFYYTKQRERRHMSKEEQLYGYDAHADAEFYAQQRQQSSRKKMSGGINFVLGATLQPEANAKQKAEQEAAAAAATAAAATSHRGTKRARNDNERPSDGDEAASMTAQQSPEEEISFRQLRQQKGAGAGARRSRQEELDEAEEEERRMAGRGGGLGFAGRSSMAAPPAAATAASSSSRGGIGMGAPAKPAPVKVDKEFAQFTRHTTGFGLKMLAALGYRPGDRLGKHGTGVINPILPKLRPKDMGLGFGDFKENDKSSYARNAQEEAELQAKEAEEAAKKKAEKAAAAAAAPVRPGWKKDGAAAASGRGGRKAKREYKTAADLVASDTQQVGGAGAVAPLVVMDYRGATARVTSLDKVTAAVEEESAGADGPAPQLLPELQHNLRLLVSMSEEEIRKLDRMRRDSQKRVQQLRDQKEHIESSVEHEERQVGSMRQLVARVDEAVTSLKSIPRSAPNSLVKRVHIVVDLLRTLRSQFKSEFVLYDLAHRTLPLVYPLVKGLLYNWQPLETHVPSSAGSDLPVLDLLALFKPLLSGTSVSSSPSGAGSFQSALHAQSSDSQHSLYHQLLEELLLPKLRLELSNPQTCSIRLHSSAILGMVGRVERVCPPALYHHIVSQLVYPSLAHEVATWNPRSDPVPVHDWVLPYTRVLPEALRHKLYDAIRLKLSITLQEWVATDHSAIHVIAPWYGRFKPDAFDALMQRSVLPKLQSMIHTQLHINPKQQDMAPFQALMPWINLLVSTPAHSDAATSAATAVQQQPMGGQRTSVTLVRNLLVQEFFPKWFRALYTWLGGAAVGTATPPLSAPDLEEVSAWYMGWKAQFPPALLDAAADPQRLLQQCFSKGLDLMNEAASEAPIQTMYEQTMRWLQSPTTTMPTHAPQQQQQAQAASQAQAGKSALSSHLPSGPAPSSSAAYLAASAEGDDTAFLGVILQLASLHSLEFEPALRKGTVQGKQIYLFGPCQVYVLRGVVYVKEGAAWAPIALDQLIERAKTQKQQPTAATGAATANARTRNTSARPAAAPATPAAPAHDDVD